MSNNGYAEALQNKLVELTQLISSKRKEISGLFNEIELLEKQANNILDLLHIEGLPQDTDLLVSLGQSTIADSAHSYLSNMESSSPVHYKELAQRILASGVAISGKDPAANLLSHMNRDDRFIRTAPGTYGIVEWGLKPMVKKTKRRRTRTRKK